MGSPAGPGLYDPRNEHDSCGVGFVVNIKGRKSHDIIRRGLQILVNLDHRGAVGADPLVGDGAGCLIQMPDKLLRDWAEENDLTLPPPGRYAVAMCFLPQDAARANSRSGCSNITSPPRASRCWAGATCRRILTGLGKRVIETMPVIRQAIVVASPKVKDQDAFERKILTIRKQTLNNMRSLETQRHLPGLSELYMPSFSTRTVVYKGLLLAPQVGTFYRDLRNPLTQSALALVHQRFSTNTFPSWRLAHPYRFLAHNGEINTVRGNVNWMYARRHSMASELIGPDLDKMWPLIPHGQSDTACIDNALEILVAGGYSLAHAMMMLIPEAWAENPLMDPERRAFYEYYAALMEPWDGPASIAFTDGRQIGATLDRNGLRPARYIVTDDDHVIMASEAGVLPVPEERIVHKWRLQPGKMLLIDLEQGRIIGDDEVKKQLATQASLRRVAEGDAGAARGAAGAIRHAGSVCRSCRPPRPNDAACAAEAAAGVRLYAGRHSVLPGADGAGGRRSRRLDGHRHADCRAVEQAEAAVQLLQAELRAGHQSADRFDPRSAGDVAGVDDRAAAEPAGPSRRFALPAGGGAADSDQHGSREGPGDLLAGRRCVPHQDHRRDLARQRRCRGHGARGRSHLRRGDRCRAGRLQHPDLVGSRGVVRHAFRCRRCWPLRRCIII